METKLDIAWIDPGVVSGHFAHSITQSARDLERRGLMGNVHRFATSMPTRGRNVLVEGFLAGPSDWLWMVDSDMVFDKDHASKLMTTAVLHEAKIVSGLAFIFKDNKQPIPSYFLENGKELHLVNLVPSEVMEVAATGLASTIVHREVFEKMEVPRHVDYRWFDQIMLDGNDQLSGEDTQFFVRARQLGYKVFLDPSAETWHLKTVGIGKQDFVRFWELEHKRLEEQS